MSRQLDLTSHLFRIMAQSPQAPNGGAALQGALSKTRDMKTLEAIALAVPQVNGCQYCLGAHRYVATGSLPIPSLKEKHMAREIIRVEPLSSWLERGKAPASVATRQGDTLYVSGLPPFNPQTGEVLDAPIEQQTRRVLEQL